MMTDVAKVALTAIEKQKSLKTKEAWTKLFNIC